MASYRLYKMLGFRFKFNTYYKGCKMKTWTWIVPLVALSVSCGKIESTNVSNPPKEMVGVWIENSNTASNSQDECASVKVGKNTVSTGLFMVNELGNVYDGKDMKQEDQPYRLIGQMDQNGVITPNDIGRREFLGNFANSGTATFNPIVTAKFGIDPFKGEFFVLKIDLQLVTSGTSNTQEWKKIDYFKTSSAGESDLIGKAKKCLSKAKSQP